MIKPTVCRIVAYWPTQQDRATMEIGLNKYFAAMVTAELPNGNFNLTVFDAWGHSHPRQDIGFVEHMETLSGYCSWPPAMLATIKDLSPAAVERLKKNTETVAKLITDPAQAVTAVAPAAGSVNNEQIFREQIRAVVREEVQSACDQIGKKMAADFTKEIEAQLGSLLLGR